MDKVYQVFVSSTYSDLKDERRQVSEFLAKDGFVPAGMELFPAADQQQLEFIKRVIDRCDYYVVIVGGRYGSLADDQISFTEKEYEYAVSREIPVLAFLHSAPDSIEVGKTDKDEPKALKLQAFRERLSKGRMVDYWSNSYELCAKVVIAVGQASTLFPGTGWVRGDQAIDPKILQDLERLRMENGSLKKRLSEFESNEMTFPSQLAGPDDSFNFVLVSTDSKTKGDTIEATWRFREIFAAISELLISEHSESHIGRNLALSYLQHFHKDLATKQNYRVDEQNLKTLRFHFEALGLIQAAGRHEVIDMGGMNHRSEYVAWVLTDKGRKFISNLWAIQRASS
jgi:hypothetical protein